VRVTAMEYGLIAALIAVTGIAVGAISNQVSMLVRVAALNPLVSSDVRPRRQIPDVSYRSVVPSTTYDQPASVDAMSC
jgi:hypothetical protein